MTEMTKSMSELVTNHMLRKQLAVMSRETRNGVTGISTSTGNNNQEEVPLFLEEKQINRVQLDEFIAVDGTRAKLFLPMPCIKWRCTSQGTTTSMIQLEKELTGLFISDGKTAYLLGVWGDTHEFEVLLQSGENEIRLNNLFLNVKANLYVANGLETELGNNGG